METQTNYPDQVKERGLEVFNAIKAEGYLEDDVNHNIFYENLCKFFFKKWLDGEENSITEDECNEILFKSIIDTDIDGLVEKGYAGIFEDENGEECVFLTEKGKQEVENIKKKENGI